MASIYSPSISASFNHTPSTKKFSQLSSSTSIFFSNKIKNQTIRIDANRKRGFSCNALFGLGVPELVVIAGVAALVFGPKQLPEVGKSLGKTIKSFQQAAKEFETELKKEPDASTPVETPTEMITTSGEEVKEDAKVSVTADSS